MGAIDQAKTAQTRFRDLETEAEQYGIVLLIRDKETYMSFRHRLRGNERLASALKSAKQAGVPIAFGERQRISVAGGVVINTKASDDEIIKFLVD